MLQVWRFWRNTIVTFVHMEVMCKKGLLHCVVPMPSQVFFVFVQQHTCILQVKQT